MLEGDAIDAGMDDARGRQLRERRLDAPGDHPVDDLGGAIPHIVLALHDRRVDRAPAEQRDRRGEEIERDDLELSAPADLPRGAAPGRPAAVRHPEGAGDVRPLLEGRPRELRPALVVVVVVLVGGQHGELRPFHRRAEPLDALAR